MENDKLNELLSALTDEQKEKAMACKTAEELLALAAREGIELPEKVLNEIAGGLYTRPMYEVKQTLVP